MQPALAAAMPTLARHRGLWRGTYRHLDAAGVLIDRHDAEVRCEFPADGPYAYILSNRFPWADGREHRATLPGVLREGLWWDVETFAGSSWETPDGILLLNLIRKDQPGANFFEMITLGATGTTAPAPGNGSATGNCTGGRCATRC